jgi:hypothetical protein
VFTAGTNGTLSIVTTDDSAAAANITITADGTAELAGTTVTLNSSGGVTLDADNGTITFADAGSSLGTITSSGYSGTAAVATTVTITDNESTNENNAIVFTAGGDLDGGDLGLESDGDLFYNPSTGTLSVTNIVTSGTHTVTNSVTMNASNAVVFEGATADAHETTLSTIDATGDRTINLPNVSGTIPVLAAASATAITSTPAELNILDGVTTTAAEINLIDGDTSRGTTAIADADGFLVNDAGTMRMTSAATVQTYMQDGAGFASGTDMIFFQAAAPTGWTKSTSNNDKALRVVTGDGGGTGGTAAFTSPAHNLTAAAHTLATNEIPSHSHGSVVTGVNSSSGSRGLPTPTNNNFSFLTGISVSTGNTGNQGGGASHTHNSSGSITTPQYIDVIVAAKD